jgi:hypothetical protein
MSRLDAGQNKEDDARCPNMLSVPRRHRTRGWAMVLMGLLLATSLCPLAAQSGSNWRLEKKQDDVSFYLRDHPHSIIPEFKAVTRIPASMAQVLAVLLDVDNYQRWIHRCTASFPLSEIDKHEQYIYQQNSVPWARDRDIILRARLSHRDHGQQVHIRLQAAPDYCRHHDSPACDRIDHDRHVRIDQAVGSYRLLQVDDQTVELTWQQHLDPGGKLPKWLVKAMLSDIPLKTLAGLREAVQDAKYRNSRLVVNGDSLRVETAPESG